MARRELRPDDFPPEEHWCDREDTIGGRCEGKPVVALYDKHGVGAALCEGCVAELDEIFNPNIHPRWWGES